MNMIIPCITRLVIRLHLQFLISTKVGNVATFTLKSKPRASPSPTAFITRWFIIYYLPQKKSTKPRLNAFKD